MRLDNSMRWNAGVGRRFPRRDLVLTCLALVLIPASGLTAPVSPLVQDHSRCPPPSWLPRYDVDMDLDVAGHQAKVRLRATWTNMHPSTPTQELVFNAHSRYIVPDKEIGFMAKMLEILRMSPGEALGVKTPACDIQRIFLEPAAGSGKPAQDLAFSYEGDTLTALVVPLPRPLAPGESATVVIELTMHLPNKQGRWGQWEGVTYLSNWLPVFAFYGEKIPPPQYYSTHARGKVDSAPDGRVVRASKPGESPAVLQTPVGASWQPTPFVPWHQPFFNESGNYEVRVTLPCDQQIASSGTIISARKLSEDRQEVRIRAPAVRDFAFLCSARYRCFEGEVKAGPGVSPVRVRILAFPEHEFYAREMVRIAIQAITIYSKWFGPYPWTDFTIAEAFFGWNGNECATLVMIDERIFAMPHLGCGYVDYLVSHEICHQWWYNLVGTNGYCETWMDEAMANYFSHRLLDQVVGRNNNLMKYPASLEWLPNIRRDDYKSNGMYGTFGRGENAPVVQEMPKFGHLVNLFNLCYDKGGRIVGMIEERLGEQAFLDFMKRLACKYRYRILRVVDFQRELEAYSGPACAGQTWEEFFQHWLYGDGLTDWAVDKVEVQPEQAGNKIDGSSSRLVGRLLGHKYSDSLKPDSYRVVVWVNQKAEYNEPTTLGFAIPGSKGYPVRVDILPYGQSYKLENPPTQVEVRHEGGKACLRVEVILPFEPEQIAVDPDQILVDADPSNNYWHPPCRFRLTPIYTFLEETDLTNAYDRWNVIAGPWIYSAPYNDAWYTRSTMLGLRAAAYRTQDFVGGAYSAIRTDYRDAVWGVDGLWSHLPDPNSQIGFNFEQRISGLYHDDESAKRGVLWGRYIFQYGSSLYLPPMHYLEGYVAYQDNFFPFSRQPNAEGERFDRTSTAGLHYRLNYLTPYFDPEGGFRFDVWYEGGVAELPQMVGLQKLSSQFSIVKGLPDLSHELPAGTWLRDAAEPVLSWFGDTRLALRAYGGTAMPGRGEFFTLGGSQLFRGFDLAQRQGSTVWVGSAEWRFPLARHLHIDACDHVFSLRNIYGAVFYDVGDAYVNGTSVGPVAHALGSGLRLDVTWFSFVERTMLTLDVAKTINCDSSVQVWLGVIQPF